MNETSDKIIMNELFEESKIKTEFIGQITILESDTNVANKNDSLPNEKINAIISHDRKDNFIKANVITSSSHAIKNIISEPFKCAICHTMYRKKNSLGNHVRRKHPGINISQAIMVKIENPDVGNPDADAINLSNQSIENTLKDSQVKELGNQLLGTGYYVLENSTNNLIKRKKIHPDNDDRKRPYECDICRRRFLEKYHLLKHQKLHSNQAKNFICPICDYKTSQAYNLSEHIKIHTGEKPYACTYCSYRCAHSSHMTLHMRTHTGDKQFKCKMCEYKSTRPSHLRVHMLTHTGEKPYACIICGKMFTHSHHLNRHVRMHMGEKPFACQYCNFKCVQSYGLKVHMRTHNKNS